jgi:hypothetical protein
MNKIIIAFIFFVGLTFAQEQTLTIGKVDLKLGTDKESVLDILDKTLYVEEDYNDEHLYSIWDSDKKNYLYGAIRFNDSKKLISVDKNWGTSVNDSHSQIFEQIIQLLDKYKSGGEIKVDTQEIFEPNYKAKKLSFIQGKKVIELSLNGNRIILKELLKESE